MVRIPTGKAKIKDILDPGEGIECLVLARKKSRRKGFSCMYNDSLTELAKLRYSGAEFSVLLTMIANMNYDNICEMSQSQIAEEIGSSKDVVSRACKELEANQHIALARKIGTVKLYQVSPYIVVKCDEGQEKVLTEHWDKKFTPEKITSINKNTVKRAKSASKDKAEVIQESTKKQA